MVSQGPGAVSAEKEAFMCGWWGEGRSEDEAGGPEVGRVMEGLGMRREPEGSGREDGLRAVGEDTERGSGGGRA